MLKHNKEIYRHFKSLIKQYLEEDESGAARKFFSNPMRENGETFMYECKTLLDGVKIVSGATKICFIEEDYPYVLKIGFVCDEGFVGKYYTNEIEVPLHIDNYCFLEAYLYERAKGYGVQDILAETVYLGTYLKVAMFCAAKFEVDPTQIDDDVYSCRSDYDGDFSEDSEENINCLLNMYGYADKVSSFWLFAQDYDLGDFHNENWGYGSNDLKCIDFSGYVGGVSGKKRRKIA